jgi:hypothetical protein
VLFPLALPANARCQQLGNTDMLDILPDIPPAAW